MDLIENIYRSTEEQRKATFMKCFVEYWEAQNER